MTYSYISQLAPQVNRYLKSTKLNHIDVNWQHSVQINHTEFQPNQTFSLGVDSWR
jgi:hypothetical protein